MIYFWFALKQRTYVDKYVKDLDFGLSYFVAICRAVGSPSGKLAGTGWVDIKAQHELTEFFEALAASG
jgi:hypothetical protein